MLPSAGNPAYGGDSSGPRKGYAGDNETDDDVKPPRAKRAREKVKPTPLPTFLIILLILVMMTEGIAAFMLMPFVGLFVSFLQGTNPNDASYLAGVLVGVQMLGNLLVSKFLGLASDRYGRRVPLIIGQLV